MPALISAPAICWLSTRFLAQPSEMKPMETGLSSLIVGESGVGIGAWLFCLGV